MVESVEKKKSSMESELTEVELFPVKTHFIDETGSRAERVLTASLFNCRWSSILTSS